MKKDIGEIKDNIVPNGGRSLSDKVDQLHKRQEEQMALVESYFSIMMNRDDEALFRADGKGNWIFCNNKASDIFGMYHRDLLGRGYEIAIGNNRAERLDFEKAWSDYINDGSPLNYYGTIKNQETNKTETYIITASKVSANGKFQFHLGKIQKAL